MNSNFNHRKVSAIIGATLMTMSLTALADDSAITIHNVTNEGSPTFVTGNLGVVDPKSEVEAIKNFLSSQSEYGFTGN